MVRRLLVLVMAFCAVGIGMRAAYACSCVPKPALRIAVDEADVAFSGTVVRRLGDNRYEVEVDEVLTGSVADRVTVRAEDPQASTCGIDVAEGPIVYTGGRDLRVSLCSAVWQGDEATQVLAASGLVHDVPTLSPTAAPEPEPESTKSLAGPVATVLGLGAAVAMAAGYLRRRRNAAASAGGTASAG